MAAVRGQVRLLLVSLLVAGATTAVLPVLERESGEDLRFPSPAIGDRVAYRLSVEGPWDLASVTARAWEIRAEWLPPETLALPNGSRLPAHAIVMSAPAFHDPALLKLQAAEDAEARYTAYFEAATGRPAGLRKVVAGSLVPAPLEFPFSLFVAPPVVRDAALDTFTFGDASVAQCLFRHSLQGRRVEPGTDLEPFGSGCDLFGLATLRTETLEGRFRKGSDGRREYVASGLGTEPGSTWEAVFANGVAYPVSVSYQAGDRVARFALVGLGEGSEPFPFTMARWSPHTLEPVARPTWTLDDSGGLFLRPFSSAFRTALEGPTFEDLREFLRANPGAYVSAAWNPVTDEWSDWAFEVTGNRSSLHVEIFHRPNALGCCVKQPVSAGSGFTEPVAYEYRAQTHERTRLHPSLAPPYTPTLASIVEAWAASELSPMGDTNLLGWDFEVVDGPHGIPEVRYALFDHDAGGRFIRLEGAGARAVSLERRTVEGPNPVALLWPDDVAPTALPPVPGFRWPPLSVAAGVATLTLLLSLLAWTLASKVQALALFSRLSEAQVRDHPARSTLLAIIRENPGIRHREILRRTGLKNGQALHHLGKLLEAGLVERHKARGRTGYAVAQAASPALAVGLQSKAARTVLAAVEGQAGLSVSELARLLAVAPSTVHHHIQGLARLGLVRLAKDGRRMRAYAAAADPVGAREPLASTTPRVL